MNDIMVTLGTSQSEISLLKDVAHTNMSYIAQPRRNNFSICPPEIDTCRQGEGECGIWELNVKEIANVFFFLTILDLALTGKHVFLTPTGSFPSCKGDVRLSEIDGKDV